MKHAKSPVPFFIQVHHEKRTPYPPPLNKPFERNYLPNNSVETVLEPLDGLSLVDTVVGTDSGLAAAALGNALTRTSPIKFNLSVPIRFSSPRPAIQ